MFRGRSCILAAFVAFTLAVGLPAAVAGADEYAFTLVAQSTPTELQAGSTVTVPLTLRNDGTVAWVPGRSFHVAYHWSEPDGTVVVWDGARSELPQEVVPGATVELDATLTAPAAAGRYLLQWDLVRENVCWFSERMAEVPPGVPVQVEAVPPVHAFSVVKQDAPRWMLSGAGRTVNVVVRNDGSLTWRPGESINLSYHWLRSNGKMAEFEGRRTRIPKVVKPGEEVRIAAQLVAPSKWGRLGLQWDMVHEGVCWFAQQDPTPASPVRVFVVPALWRAPWLPTGVALLLAVAVLMAWRRGSDTRLAAVLAWADLGWLLVSLLVKQRYVLEVAERMPAPGSGLAVASGVALIALLLLALPRRLRPVATWLVTAIASLVILGDVVYLRYFGDVTSMAAFAARRQLGQVEASVQALMHRTDLWVVADLLPGLIVAAGATRFAKRLSRRLRWVLATVLALLVLPGVGTVWRASHAKWGRLVQVFQSLYVVQEVGDVNYHLADLWSTLRSGILRPPLAAAQRGDVESWFKDREPLRAGVGPWFGAGRGKNLLMIQVESMQRWVVGLKINGQEVTPNLDHWLPGAAWFPRMTDQTSQGRTSDGEVTTQVSLLPLARGAVVFKYPRNHYVGIAGVLRQHGYTTMSAVPFHPTFWNRHLMHPAFGYTTNLFADDFGPGERIGWGLNDRDFLAQAEQRLAHLQQPFCAWLITLSLHHPFEGFPKHLEVLDVGRWEGTPFGNYLHTMHFFDQALGGMVDRLAADGLLDKTVIALWGDHDAGFVWDADLAQAIGIHHHEADWYLADRVPFLVHVPGGPSGTFRLAAGQTDVAPTLLALLGVDPAPYAFVGRNLLGEPGDVAVPRPYGGWLSDRYLYVSRGPGLADGVCYDAHTLKAVPVAACAHGTTEADREVDVADLVLRYDLQQELTRTLQGEARPPVPQ
ncbi:MAG: sulfatase-like hydrolase/transferase [Acidobacteria bacterium]|nr:sulfatase-like hydrolase/transferase [Acidobacteriota bacterium]